MTWLVIPLVACAIVAVWFCMQASYYRRIFSVQHFREVHSTIVELIEAQRTATSSGDDVAPPGRALTSVGLVFGVTYRIDGDAIVLHISLSQHQRPTTAAVANRFAFFLLCAVNGNELSLDPFFTRSGVRHLVFTGGLAKLAVNDFATTFDAYRSTYQPLPFAQRVLAQAGAPGQPGEAG